MRFIPSGTKCSIIFICIVLCHNVSLIVGMVGGRRALPSETRFIAQIRAFHPSTKTWERLCVGCIINEHTILLPGLCGMACDVPDRCKVFVGEMMSLNGGIEVKVNTSHNLWFSKIEALKWDNPFEILKLEPKLLVDIALMHVHRIPFSKYVGPIKLPTENMLIVGGIKGVPRTMMGYSVSVLAQIMCPIHLILDV